MGCFRCDGVVVVAVFAGCLWGFMSLDVGLFGVLVVWVSGVVFPVVGCCWFLFLELLDFWCAAVWGVVFVCCQPVIWCFIGCLYLVLLVAFRGGVCSGDGGLLVFPG